MRSLVRRRSPRYAFDDIARPFADGPLGEVEVLRTADRALYQSGPDQFADYTREVVRESDGSGSESVEVRIHARTLRWLFEPLVTHAALRAPDKRSQTPWYLPPDRLDARSAESLDSLALLALVAGFLTGLPAQTTAFAADTFGAGESTQAWLGTAIRIGAAAAMVFVGLADRWGRRRVLLAAGWVGCLAGACGVFAPNIAALGAVQVVERSMAAVMAIVIPIMAAEEVPAGARAYSFSLLAIAGGLGAGAAVVTLPLADAATDGWRYIYLLSLIWIPVLIAARRLGETRRFERPHLHTHLSDRGRRLALLCTTGLLTNILFAPSSFFLNQFLKEERGYSGSRVALFVALTSTTAMLGMVLGSRLAETRGRRSVAAVAMAVGSAAVVATFLAHGWPIWAWSLVSSAFLAALVPAYGVYGPELFPTGSRGAANGVVTVVGLVGSGIGLLGVGWLAERWGSLGVPMAWAGVTPLLAAGVVLLLFPETAHVELEQLNPEDSTPGSDHPPALP